MADKKYVTNFNIYSDDETETVYIKDDEARTLIDSNTTAINTVNTDLTNSINTVNTDLTNSIAETNANIADKEDKKYYLFVGDSIGTGYNPDGNVTPWPTIINTFLGGTNYQNLSIGGCGFKRGASDTLSPAYLINNNTITDADKITDVIVGLGTNDIVSGVTLDNISTGISDFLTACKSKLSNVKRIKIFFTGIVSFGNVTDSSWTSVTSARCKTILTYYTAASTYSPLISVSPVIGALAAKSFFASDGVHLSGNGQYELAKTIYTIMLGMDYNFNAYNPWYSPDLSVDGPFSSGRTADNEIIQQGMYYYLISIPANTTMNGSWIKIWSYAYPCLIDTYGNGYVQWWDGTSYYVEPCLLKYQTTADGITCYMSCAKIDSAGTGYYTAASYSQCRIWGK